MNDGPILELDQLEIAYRTEGGWLEPVRKVSLRVQPHEKYGLVGESGSGKTTLALGIMRYLPANGLVRGGRVLLNGTDLLKLSGAEMRQAWGGQIGMVYQNPSTALNPALVIGEQIAEVAQIHLKLRRKEAWVKAVEMLGRVRIADPAAVATRYPHQLSGGMLQRALIAMALTSNPQLLIMDEPTTALDVTTEAVVLDLIQSLSQEYGSAILYITHNLGVVARICDRVGVMYAGELMEEAPVGELFRRPLHPYTGGLISCAPNLDSDKRLAELNTIPGYIPRLDELPLGCIFAPRCDLAKNKCRQARPPMVEVAPGRFSACLRWEELVDGDDRRSAVSFPHPAFGRPLPEGEAVTESPLPLGEGQGEGIPGTQPPTPDTLLEARDVTKYFKSGGLGVSFLSGLESPPVKAVDGISVELPRGQTLGIVGESGCGKTTFGRCIVGLERPTEGEIRLGDELLPPSVANRPRATLKRIQMVFQNPDASLNPKMTVSDIIGRPLVRLSGLSGDHLKRRTSELLHAVHLPQSYLSRLPEELSGGEKQRVAIARAFAADPELVICDEPVSALDVSVQGALLNLLAELQRSQGVSYLFISHDLAAVRHLADMIAVVYLGRLWEVGTTAELFEPPYHPYTEALLSAIPVPDPDIKQKRIRLEGSVPSAINTPSGCRFHTRCPRKIGQICESQEPPWRMNAGSHRICCHIELEELKRIQVPVLRRNGGPNGTHSTAEPNGHHSRDITAGEGRDG
jgi:peptide/nickel transport system ATP-binding protein